MEQVSKRAGPVLAFSTASLVLMGFAGSVWDLDGNRFTQVTGRGAARSIDFTTDTVTTVCAYQLRNDGTQAVLACSTPSVLPVESDACGVAWYSGTLSFNLLQNRSYWGKTNGPEFTRVLVARSGTSGDLYTGTDDYEQGPMDATACYRSRYKENAALSPIVFYNGAVPDDLDCGAAGTCIGGISDGLACTSDAACIDSLGVIDGYCYSRKSMAGCPFSCNLPSGCDTGYGRTDNDFFTAAYRTNSSGQTTATTRFDHYGATSGHSPPAGDWSYQPESGMCDGIFGNDTPCEAGDSCVFGFESCDSQYTVMRRNSYTNVSLNIRRGQNRRDSLVEGYVKMKYVDTSNREIGLVSRFYDNDNYYVFMVREYPSDFARIQRRRNGTLEVVTTAAPVLNLLAWTQLSFLIRDNGTVVNAGFAPSGTCNMSGKVNGATVISSSNVGCGRAPYGNYGVYSFNNSSAQFYELDAFACAPGAAGKCFK